MLTSEVKQDGSPTRARTWDLRINSPSLSFAILLHYQLPTASAHLRHRSRVQCNARACKTTLLRFCIQVPIDQCVLPARVAKRRCLRRAREFPVPYKDCATVTCRPHRVTE